MILAALLSKRFKFLLMYLFLLLSCGTLFSGCSDGQEKITEKYELVDYYPEIFISQDYIFNNEGLNMPWHIKENPDGEIVILDAGNVVFYVFSPEGKFLRMFSRVGQGPGEILEPRYFDIDYEGDIYVYDYGNQRLTILNKEGKYLNSFRVPHAHKRTTKMHVTKNKEILINIPERGFFITVFSRNGEIVREIGEIQKEIQEMPRFIEVAASAHPFMDEEGNYYAFIDALLKLNVYNKEGTLIRERNLDELLDMPIFRKNYIPPYTPGNSLFTSCSEDVIFKYDKFYLIQLTGDFRDVKTFHIYVINLDLHLMQRIALNLNEGINLQGSFRPRFDVIENGEEILFPLVKSSEILKFTKSK